MKALRAHTRAGPEVLVYEDAPRPEPVAGDVLVAVHAAAITYSELDWETTWTRNGVARTPTIPSHEVSGIVVDVGPAVEGAGVYDSRVPSLAVGDEVFGLVPFDRNGAAAEYVALPAQDAALRPTSVSHVVAAAAPLAALTALQAIDDHLQLKPGQRLLVHGGAGGVGAFAVQFAVDLGAEVTVTALGADADFVFGLGVDRVIDFQAEEFDAGPERYDAVLDTVGGQTLHRSFDVLERGGRLVTLTAPPPAELAEAAGVTAIFFVVSPDAGELGRIAELIDAEALQVRIAGTFPLAQGRAAFASGGILTRDPGKTVLVVVPDQGRTVRARRTTSAAPPSPSAARRSRRPPRPPSLRGPGSPRRPVPPGPAAPR
jgi:NADPH:quinone reductase-like Zn-dependent oxidoreductase